MGRRIGTSCDWHVRGRTASLVGAILSTIAVLGAGDLRAADTGKPSADQRVLGRALFEREWLPGDSRTRGGDGLGPVFNDSSCIACHNLGGNGGGGPSSKNVDIITASANGQNALPTISFSVAPSSGEPGFLGKALGSLIGLDVPQRTPAQPSLTTPAPEAPPARRKVDNGPLVKAHPGFRTSRSVVLHRFGTEAGYEGWRQSLLGLSPIAMVRGVSVSASEMTQHQNAVSMGRQQFLQNTIGQFQLVRTQRNPTALFGAGLIDAIPDRAIEDAAKAKHPEFPEIAGRVSQLKDKRIGRFGWKAQTPTLEDFVLTACAVELGLEVPGHHQGGNPQKLDAQAKGLDLSAQECNALLDYVRALPKPAERQPATEVESREVAAGRKLFASTGCATCHAPKLGNVEGLYSDLLIHDLGFPLGDTGQYGVFDPSSSDEEINDEEGPIADAAAVLPAPAAPVLSFVPGLRPNVTVTEPATRSFAREAAKIEAELGITQEATAVAPQRPAAAPDAVPPVTAPGSIVLPPVPPTETVPVVLTAPAAPTVLPVEMIVKRPTSGPASRFEWRTAPLWGFRDSGPYLHDGRADTIDQAVALHGGEATTIASKYFSLSPRERRQVEAFLKSLTAPEPVAPEQVASAR